MALLRTSWPIALALFASSPAQSHEWRGQARLWLGGGFDSNSPRDYAPTLGGTHADGLGAVVASLDGAFLSERFRAFGSYDGGGRKFLLLASEDTLVNNATLEVSATPFVVLDVGATGRARDRRGAARDYSDFAGEFFLEFIPDDTLSVRARAGAHRFVYWPAFAASFGAFTAGATARYRFTRRHSVSATFDYEGRGYNADAANNPQGDPVAKRQRRDAFFSANASYAYRGPFQFSATYGFIESASNSFGESFRRHRLALMVGVALPWELTILGNIVGQLSQVPDGVYASGFLTTLEEDEGGSSASFKLVKALGDHFDLDVRYAFYFNILATNGLIYARHVASLGVAVHF